MSILQRRWHKVLLYLVMVLMVGGGWAAPAQADGPATATLPQVTIAPDGSSAVNLALDAGGVPVMAVDLRLTWDPQVVRVAAMAQGDLATGWAMSSNLSVEGELRVAMAGTQAIGGAGELLELTIEAVGAEGTLTPLTVAQCSLNDGALACTLGHGQVTVSNQGPMHRVQLPLVLGWNLLSLPVTPSSTLISDVLSSIEGQYDLVLTYDGLSADNPWRTYAPGVPDYVNDLERLEAGQGFWIKATAPATLVVDGYAAQGDLALAAGWHLVGYRGLSAAPVADALSSLDGQYDVIYAFDAADTLSPWRVYSPSADPQGNDLSLLEPGMGYWILMNQPGVWASGS